MSEEAPDTPAAEAAVPTYDELFTTALDALRAHAGQATNAQIASYVVAALGLPREVVQAQHQPGRSLTRLEYNLQWTRTYLRRYGLIDSPRRAVWMLTPAGWQVGVIDPHEIARTVRSQMSAARLARDGQTPIFGGDDTGPELTATPIAASELAGPRSLTPNFPTYTNVRHFLRVMDGVTSSAYHDLSGAIQEQSGNPQEQADWSDPDGWIAVRLTGETRELAERIWLTSERSLNPRYTRGCWHLALRHGLLARRFGDTLRVTERGQQFLDKPGGALDTEIDAYEGVLIILNLVAEHGVSRRSDLLPAYAQFCRSDQSRTSAA
jgi:hypothetical protein